MNLLEISGGRRFVLAAAAGLASTILQWFGKLDAAGSTYAILVIGTVGAYIGSDTFQKIKGVSDTYTDRQAGRITPSTKLPRGIDNGEEDGR